MYMSRTRPPTMPVPVIPIGQAHSYLPYGAHSNHYEQSGPPFPVTPSPPRHAAYDGTVMHQKVPRNPTTPMPTSSPWSSDTSTFASPGLATSPAGWSPSCHDYYLSGATPDVPPVRTNPPDLFSVLEGNQYAEPESMVGWSSGAEYPPPLWGRPQESLPHLHSLKPHQRHVHDVLYPNEDLTPPPSPPNQHARPYGQSHLSPSATSYSYPSNYDRNRHPQTPPRPHQTHATTLQSWHSQTSPPLPPPMLPRSIAQSRSGPASTSQSSSGARQSSVYVSGKAVPYSNEIEYGGNAHRFPEVRIDHPPSSGSRRPVRTGAGGAATLPPSLNTNGAASGRRPAPGTQSVFGNGNCTVYEEPKGFTDGSDWTTGHISPKEGTKKALVIGIAYKGQAYVDELRGCINDVCLMAQFLIDYGGYLQENIVVLSDDDEIDPNRRATKENILRWMDWLVDGAKEDDSLFFHFSGHGIQVKDINGDETSGYDDAILPIDHEEKGCILDDELNSRLVQRLPKGSRLTALVDACHSGTSLDLPFEYFNDDSCTEILDSVDGENIVVKGTEADVVSFSSCKDNEVCQDTTRGEFDVGAMTSTFLEAFNPDLTYRQFLSKIGNLMNGVNNTQKPQLGASHKINLDAKFIF